MPETIETEESSSRAEPGWFDNPVGPGLRYWDGERWTDSYHPGRAEAGLTKKEALWALSLGFGATGAVGAIAIPLLAFYFPLGFGIAGAALAIVAGSHGRQDLPWYAALAVVATLISIGTGLAAYDEFQSRTAGLDEALEELR